MAKTKTLSTTWIVRDTTNGLIQEVEADTETQAISAFRYWMKNDTGEEPCDDDDYQVINMDLMNLYTFRTSRSIKKA